MARFNPWDERRKRRTPVEDTRTFELEPGEGLEITLRELRGLAEGQVRDQIEEWVATYLKPTNGKPPQVLTGLDGVPLPLSQTVISDIAFVRAMEVIPEGEAPYSLSSWARLVDDYPEVWREIVAWAVGIGARGPDAGNAPGAASTETSSEPPAG